MQTMLMQLTRGDACHRHTHESSFSSEFCKYSHVLLFHTHEGKLISACNLNILFACICKDMLPMTRAHACQVKIILACTPTLYPVFACVFFRKARLTEHSFIFHLNQTKKCKCIITIFICTSTIEFKEFIDSFLYL